MKERPTAPGVLWVENCNDGLRYRYQGYLHSGGGIFIGYTLMKAFNIYPFAERAQFYIPLRRDFWGPRESSIIHMTMSPWTFMYNVRDYLNSNDRIRRNTDMISMQAFYRFMISSVLHTAQNGIRYHQDADSRLTHPTCGLIGPVSELFMRFVQDYGIVRLL